MVPLLFIIIVVSVLSLLIYWVLSDTNVNEHAIRKITRFNYELAPELYTYGESELYVPQNSIKFSGNNANNLLAYWNLSQTKLEEIARQKLVEPDPEQIVLRLYEVNEWINYHDIKVKSLAGRCRFELQPGNSYYLELGVGIRNHFVPVLTSKTIKIPYPSTSANH